MASYEHIAQMEQILDDQEALLQDLTQVLERLEGQQQKYGELIKYYYSDQRASDLQDDEAGKIPQDLKRGVLSEDAIYDLMISSREAALQMMHTALALIEVS